MFIEWMSECWTLIIAFQTKKYPRKHDYDGRSSVRLSVCLNTFHIFIFFLEPLGLFQPNLAQSILGRRGFKFIQMKDHTLLQGGDNYEIAKIKKSFPKARDQFQPN